MIPAWVSILRTVRLDAGGGSQQASKVGEPGGGIERATGAEGSLDGQGQRPGVRDGRYPLPYAGNSPARLANL